MMKNVKKIMFIDFVAQNTNDWTTGSGLIIRPYVIHLCIADKTLGRCDYYSKFISGKDTKFSNTICI